MFFDEKGLILVNNILRGGSIRSLFFKRIDSDELLVKSKLEKFRERGEITIFVGVGVNGGKISRSGVWRKNVTGNILKIAIDVSQVIANGGGGIGFGG
jgi:hypothetical protein